MSKLKLKIMKLILRMLCDIWFQIVGENRNARERKILSDKYIEIYQEIKNKLEEE